MMMKARIEIRIMNRKSRRGKRKRENPYATRTHENRTPMVVVKAYMMVFRRIRG